MVEAQHFVSTLRLVDSLDEQQILESLLEDTKPKVPADCQHLEYLLATPFRYGVYPGGSRFRRAGQTPGVLYAARKPATAAAEMAHYRMQFYRESPDTAPPSGTAHYTAFSMSLATPVAFDLTSPRLNQDAAKWTHPTDYGYCQALADQIRETEGEIILSTSVRDPEGGQNVNVLTCAAFSSPGIQAMQSWSIKVTASSAIAVCEFPRLSVELAI
ncbi:MAG: RES family NAD+ phosphorylase [Pseudomonadota bacterium]